MTDERMLEVFRAEGGLGIDDAAQAIAHLLKRASSIAGATVSLDVVPISRGQCLLWAGCRVIYRGKDLEAVARSVLETDPAVNVHVGVSEQAV